MTRGERALARELRSTDQLIRQLEIQARTEAGYEPISGTRKRVRAEPIERIWRRGHIGTLEHYAAYVPGACLCGTACREARPKPKGKPDVEGDIHSHKLKIDWAKKYDEILKRGVKVTSYLDATLGGTLIRK